MVEFNQQLEEKILGLYGTFLGKFSAVRLFVKVVLEVFRENEDLKKEVKALDAKRTKEISDLYHEIEVLTDKLNGKLGLSEPTDISKSTSSILDSHYDNVYSEQQN